LLSACGGGGTSSVTGVQESYTASAGAGEVMRFGIDTVNLTYTYTIAGTSYSTSGVTVGQSGSGTLASNGDGTYAVGASDDGFIQAGRVRPVRAMFVGHVVINTIGGTDKIPVFGLSNPITTLADLADNYNFEGFSCNARHIANVTGRAGCRSHYGTASVDITGGYTTCVSGDLNDTATHPCSPELTGTLQPITAYPGVFDYVGASGHIGWLFAFTATNGSKIMVIDHDDGISLTHEFGHSIFTSSVALNSGDVDGKYFVKNNEGGEHLVTISGTVVSMTLFPGVTGTLTYNSPWTGMTTYNMPASGILPAASGVAMTARTGVYTSIAFDDPARFAVGFKYQ
jgi:hypothetical protein